MDLKTVSDVEGWANKYNVAPSTRLLTYDFVLVTDKETAELRDKEARKQVEKLEQMMKIVEGLIVPDVD